MKPLKAFLLIVLVSVFSFSSCTETDDPEIFYDISGNVTYPDGVASGALVYLVLGSTPSTNYVDVTVADETGNYSFDNLSVGDYFLFSNYNTANTNNVGGRLSGINFTTDDSNLVSVGSTNATANISLINNGSAGVVINTVDETYRLDGSHSNVNFEFPFDEGNATFLGSFDSYDFTFDFDDSDLANSEITASIDLLDVDTGQPGRDGLWTNHSSVTDVDSLDANDNLVTWFDAGCLTGYLGAAVGTHLSSVLTENLDATFTSTSIELFGDGYKASGDLTFRGQTKEIEVYFKFIKGFLGGSNSDLNYSSFEAMFVFDAISYGVSSSHLLDDVTVYASVQVREN